MDSNDQNPIRVTLTRHVDRISTLPDDVITNSILSLLPTRDSIRTSALSTRWKHLYASVPVLKFTDWPKNLNNQTDPTAFACFVSNVLNAVVKKLSCVSEFYISLDHIRVTSSVIISWIETVTSHSVQKLDVYAFWVEPAPLPRCLFTCETLVSLSLDLRFPFSVPDKVCLPKLKNLWLKHLIFSDELDDESVRRLFSSCPVLEKLMVFSSSGPSNATVFSVSSDSLKDLYLNLGHPSIEISINCPNLEELECDSYAARGYSGDVLGSLKKCEIDLALYQAQQFEQGKLIELARQVCKVQSLSLAGDSMQTLLVPTGSLPTFENLTHLKLESTTHIGWRLLSIILDSSPRLGTLDLAKGFFDIDNYFGNPYSPPEHVPICLSFHLKVIKIGRFIGEEEEYKWVEYFLTNALVLEKLEIRLWSSEDSEEENDPVVVGEGVGVGEGEGGGGGGGEGEVEVEVEGEVQVEGEGEGNGEVEDEGSVEVEDEAEVEVEGEGEGEGQEEEEDQEVVGSEFEQHFEISKRLLSYQRSSEVCQIVLLPPHY